MGTKVVENLGVSGNGSLIHQPFCSRRGRGLTILYGLLNAPQNTSRISCKHRKTALRSACQSMKPTPSQAGHPNSPAKPSGPFAQHSHEFFLAEYDALRRELIAMISENRAVERNVVISVGVSWAWLFHERQNIPRLAWLLPCLFAALGLVRALGYRRYFRDMFSYQCTVEDSFFVENGPIGWDNHHGMRGWTRLSTGAFWGLLISVTVLISVYEIWFTG
jgi:hypothetical protein